MSRADPTNMQGMVAAVARSPTHTFSKLTQDCIQLLAGLGVQDDAHMGSTVRHRWIVPRDSKRPNLRQVHLIHGELLAELGAAGFVITAGQIGENITTRGIDLPGLPTRARMHLGETAVIEVTGLRNPCYKLDRVQPGLMAAVLGRDARGRRVSKSGIMGIVVEGGAVRPGDPIRVELPPGPHQPLRAV